MLRLLALLFFAALNGEVFAANDWVNLLAQDPTGGLVTGHVCYSTNGHDLSCDAGAPTITSGTLYVATSVSSTAGYFGTVSATTYYGDGSHLSGVGAGDRIVSGTLLAVANSATGYISLTTGAANWGYLSSGISYLPNLQTSTLSATVISVTAVQIVSQSTSPVTCNSGNSGTLRYNSPTTTLELCNGSGWQPMGVGIPAGTISAFASTTCPTGWSEFTTARGRFLRGIDNGAGLDPNGTRAPGGTQVDTFQGHVMSGVMTGAGAVGPEGSSNVNQFRFITSGNSSTPVSDGIDGTPRTSGETRPVNVAVTFCQFNGTSNGWNTPLGGATPAGSTNDVQFNSGGSLAADSGNFTYSSGVLKVKGISVTTNQTSVTTLYASGNIGIGTTAPGARLEVNDQSQVPVINVYGADSSQAGVNIGVSATNRWSIYRDSAGGTFPRGLGIFEATTGAGGSTVTRLAIAQGGNVGVGAVVPTHQLTIAPPTTLVPNVRLAGGNGGGYLMSNATYPDSIWISGGTEFNGSNWIARATTASMLDLSGGGMSVFVSGNAVSGSALSWNGAPSFTVASSGNVGIGTTSPYYPLDVRTGTNQRLFVRPAFSGQAGLTLMSGSDANTVFEPLTLEGSSVLINAATGGNVGIGTTTAGSMLTVNGSANIMAGNPLMFGSNSAGTAMFFDSGTPGLIFYNANGGAHLLTLNNNGNATLAGTLTQSSDARLKKNIQPIPGALDKLSAIRGVTFNWKDKGRDPRQQVGVIAQDVQKTLPQLVTMDASGTLSVNYNGMVAPLIEAVKELKADNDNLRDEFEAYKRTHP